MSALTRLAEKVDAGTATPADFSDAWPRAMNFEHTRSRDAYYGSLDAAKALHESVLTEWRITNLCQFEAGHWYVRIHHLKGDDWPKWEAYPFHETSNIIAARAWLLAIIRALASTQPH